MLYPPCYYYYYYYYAIVPCYIPRQPSLKGCWMVLTQDQKALLKLLETARKNAYEAGIRDVRWYPALSNLSSHQTWLVGKIYRLVGTFIDLYDFIWFIIWLCSLDLYRGFQLICRVPRLRKHNWSQATAFLSGRLQLVSVGSSAFPCTLFFFVCWLLRVCHLWKIVLTDLNVFNMRWSLGTANRTKVQLLRLLQTQKETLGLRLCNDGGSAFLANVYSGLIQNLLISW